MTQQIGEDIRPNRAIEGRNAHHNFRKKLRHADDAGGEIHLAGRMKRLPSFFQLRHLQGRLQLGIQEQALTLNVDHELGSAGGRARTAPGDDPAAFMAGGEVAEFPGVLLNVQITLHIFQRIGKEVIARGRIVEVDDVTIVEAFAESSAANIGVEVGQAHRMK